MQREAVGLALFGCCWVIWTAGCNCRWHLLAWQSDFLAALYQTQLWGAVALLQKTDLLDPQPKVENAASCLMDVTHHQQVQHLAIQHQRLAGGLDFVDLQSANRRMIIIHEAVIIKECGMLIAKTPC